MPVLSKHAVLSGPVDFCCLPCERTFRSRAEAEQHVGGEAHTASLAATAYSEKFSDEGIRKVRQLLYCEACDTVIPSSRKVQSHVANEEHQFNKENGEPPAVSSLFRRVGDEVIASESILISSAAWNGIVEESCAVCDCDWEQLNAHLADVKHVINLILTKVQSGIGDSIFRKIDNAQFQCLTCNAVLPQADFVGHGETRDHQRLHIQCRKAKRALDESMRTLDESKRDLDESKRDLDESKRTLDESKRDLDESKRDLDESKRALDESKRTLDDATHKQDDKSAHNENEKSVKSDENVGTKIQKYKDSTTLIESQKKTMEDKEPNSKVMVDINDKDKEAEKTDTEKELEKKDSELKAKEEVKKVIKIKKEPEPPVNELLYDDLNTELELNSYMLNTLPGRVLCVLCNWEFEIFQYKMHLNMEHHKILESMHKEEVRRLNESKIKRFSKEKQMIYNMVDQLKDDHVTANFLKDKADCNKCMAVFPLELDRIVAHIDSHKQVEREKKEADAKEKKEREEAEAKAKREKDAAKEVARKQQEEYYKENKITFKDRLAICTVCRVEMSNIKKCINEHINGARHKRNTEKQPVDESDYETYDSSSDDSAESLDLMKSVRMDKFVALFKTSEDCQFCLVNNTICLRMASYTLTSPENNYCLLCETFFSSNPDLFFHINDAEHKCKMAALPVCTALKQEFVRMIKPNIFHCGICNVHMQSWKTLMNHIRHADDHKENRILCCFAMITLRPDTRVTADALKFIAKVNEANGRTYFN